MKGTRLLLLMSGLASISVSVIQKRATSGSSNLLLSALCFENGRLREVCLHDVPTQRLIEELFNKLTERPAERMQEMSANPDKDLIGTDTIIPEKRGREKNSGFYSNW